MTKKSIFSRWVQKSSFLLAAMLAFSCAVHAQANFWSVFGNAGCSSSNNYSMPCTVTPSSTSFTSIPLLNLYGFAGYTNNDYFKNSVYDASGHLLFSVNANGIFAPDPYGTLAYGFANPSLPYAHDGVTVAAGSYITTTSAVSEITIFPVPGDCTGYKYYVVFWCSTDYLVTTHADGNILRCIEVDIQPASFGVATDPTTWYTVTDNAINPDSKVYGSTNAASCLIVADALNTDGSRDIYTITPDVNTAYTPIYYSTISKWEFSNTGGLPTAAIDLTPYTYGGSYLQPCFTSKAEILTMPSLSSPGSTTDKYLCFAYMAIGSDNIVQTFDLSTGVASSTYTAPTTLPAPSGAAGTSTYGEQEITGFEYLPAPYNEMYFTYTDYSFYDPSTSAAILTGGLCTAPPPSLITGTTYPANYTIALTSGSTSDYMLSDLLRDKNGDLYLVNTNLMALAYLATGTGGSIATASSPVAALNSATPTTLVPFPSCTSYPNVSVNNFQPLPNGSPVVPWYLGNQIRGENYNNWSTIIQSYTILTGTSVIWTPSSNPVQNGASTINVNSIYIEPGASLEITGMTLQMSGTVQIEYAPSSASYAGGRLTLNGTTLTGQPSSPCSPGIMQMWGGVHVTGDPAQPQTYDYATSHQGGIYTDYSTISYATVGIVAGELAYATPIPFPIPQGGGIVEAENTTFINNTTGVGFAPYDYFGGGEEWDNISYFTGCHFKSTDISTIPGGSSLYGILAYDVFGIDVNGCDFSNNSGTPNASFGIYASDAGFNVTSANVYLTPTSAYPVYVQSTFSNYTDGIYHSCTSQTHTITVQNSIFNGNNDGIYLTGSINPGIFNNTFNIPRNIVEISLYPPIYTTANTMGIYLSGAYLYWVFNNTFNEVPGSGPMYTSSLTTIGDNTVGILAWSTQYGHDEGLINNNTYHNIGTANLSNYKNRDWNNGGLWYKCNTYRNSRMDEASEGLSSVVDGGDGIRFYQGIQPGFSYMFGSPYGPGITYLATPWGLTSANSFSSGSTVRNLQCDISLFTYAYSDATGTSPLEVPNVPPTTGTDYGPVTLTGLSIDDGCSIPFSPVSGGGGDGGGGGPIVYDIGDSPLPLETRASNPTDNYLIALNNIHYYMANPAGVTHRDSLYYWLGTLNFSSSKMVIAHLLQQDGFVDSAKALYQSITVTDTMDRVDSAEFTGWGQVAFNMQSKIIAHKASMDQVIQYANDNSLDVDSLVNVDSTLFRQPALDSASEDSVIMVFNNSRHWGRVMAENILSEYDTARYNALIAGMPDTVLYPIDTLPMPAWPNGVLAVTEISQGPISGCQYAELIVANCGSDEAPYVNVGGWIIDDNAGNFDTAGCAENGVTRGHYRLSPTSLIWQNIAVGSRIVMYNADANCYNLPDTFTVDSVHDIFWIPVYGTSALDSYVLERYAGTENMDSTSYCSDTGITVYKPACTWEQTFTLAQQDAVQVRCPGCTAAYPSAPAFYQGIGYAPDSTYCFVPVQPDTNELGGPMEYNPSANQKYVFTGSTVADFANPLMWTAYNADLPGIAPPTLGYVDSALAYGATYHLLGLPCCGGSSGGGGGGADRTSNPAPHPTAPVATTTGNITVYPNPATMMLYFQFPAGDVTIKLMDVTGRIMDEQVIVNNTGAAFNVQGYAPGIYLYQVVTEGKTQTGKIMVE